MYTMYCRLLITVYCLLFGIEDATHQSAVKSSVHMCIYVLYMYSTYMCFLARKRIIIVVSCNVNIIFIYMCCHNNSSNDHLIKMISTSIFNQNSWLL